MLYRKFARQLLFFGSLLVLLFFVILAAYVIHSHIHLEGENIFRILIFSGLLLCMAFGVFYLRFMQSVRNKFFKPLEKALAVLKSNGITPTQEENEAEALYAAVRKAGSILSIDGVRQKIYPFWNAVFEEDEMLKGSLKLFGESGQILSGAFYRYNSFTDELVLQAAYAFPEDGRSLLSYGQGPVGEAVALNKMILVKDPQQMRTLVGETDPLSAVGCLPVCTQRVHGVVVLAFPAHAHEDVVQAMQIFANQLGIVLDRLRQLEDLRTMASELNSRTVSLNHELKHMNSILNSSADGIIILTPEGQLTSFSRGAERITGYTATEVVGKECCQVMQHYSHDFESLCGSGLCALCQAASEKVPVIGKEVYLVNKNEEYVPVLLSSTPILDEDGNVVEVLQIFKDLTEIKNNLTQLEQASRSKTEFLATMSHELRTPLNAVLGFTELLETEAFGALSEKQKRFTSNIHTAGKHLLSLINDILDISRVEAGKMEWEQEQIDLPTLFGGAVSLLREKAAQTGIKINLEIQPDLQKFVGDERKIKQITYNLLANAVKFTPEGGQVGVKVARTTTALEVEVWDTGIGIPLDKRNAIFESFYQVDNSLTRKHQGSGLGLALVKKMVQLAGGEISVGDGPGKSTVFKFTIPEHTPCLEEIWQEPRQSEPLLAATKAEKLCVLIEDDAGTAELLETYLTEMGIKAIIATSGEEGLDLIKAHKPELAVLDIMLPGISGWDVLVQLKSTPDLCATPVLVVSILEEKKKGLALGAKDFLIKPIEKNLLQACLARILKLQDKTFNALVIDDDSKAIELMESFLETIDVKVHSTLNGVEGLKKAQALMPDIILLDLMMPEMDGFEFLKLKEENEAISSIPVVVITSKTLSPKERSFLEERTMYIARKSEFGKESFMQKVVDLMEEGEARCQKL